MNPDILLDNEKLFDNSAVDFKNDMEKYSKKYKHKIDWIDMIKWDNGRYNLLLNEDKLLK